MNLKPLVSAWIRRLGLIRMVDAARFRLMRTAGMKQNRRFVRDNPGVVLPPDDLMYEAFRIDYHRYFNNGRKTAEWLLEIAGRHRRLDKAVILDWGCGPGRVIRHLPLMLPSAKLHGSDYNPRSVKWCSDHLKDIGFSNNRLMPPLDYPDGMFDMVYAISIFTHLSENAHLLWLDDLVRVLKPGGLLFFTLHGAAFEHDLNREEMNRFRSGRLVIRGQTREGHRTYTAYHPEAWVRKWTSSLDLLEFIQGGSGEQDVWIFSKP